jgi:hypothetical protein
MLRAHYNMPAADFIAQLRTYVIALGLSPLVVDQVDNLMGADDFQREYEKELQELEDKAAKETKEDILRAVNEWLDNSELSDLTKEQRESLLAAIEDA